MSVINVKGLTFGYEGSWDDVFDNVCFQLDTQWRLGFIGRNGKGKTTFLKLLMGEYKYSGVIMTDAEFTYFPYEVKDMSRNTLELLKDIAGAEIGQWRIERELNKLDVRPDALEREFGILSNGEQTKALLAAMFLKQDRFLLIDEPTNHLDSGGRALVSEYLRGKKGFILVSHDRAFLDGCVDHILSLNRSGAEIQSGNFTSWYENKLKRDAYELAENTRLKKDIARLREASRQAGAWADRAESTKIGGKINRAETKSIGGRAYIGEQSRKLQQRRKSMERRMTEGIKEREGLLKDIEETESLRINHLDHHAERMIELKDCVISYDGRKVFRPVSMQIGRGEKIALQGKNGSGKSSLLKLICGEKIDFTGEIFRAAGLKISYVPQDASFLQGSLEDYAGLRGIDVTLFKTLLRKMDFSRMQFEKDMGLYSAGQKKKVLLAGSLCESAHLYVWDEPLNYIDVFSRMQIEQALADSGAAMLFVEHDAAFCANIADRCIVLQ